MRTKTIINPDKEFVNEIKHDLKGNNGFCPCKLVHIPENKCPCKDFKEQQKAGTPGACSCGLYLIVEDDDAGE